jgi:hypothetical protein
MKSFDEFWEIYTSHYSLHSYRLRYFMTMNDNGKVTLVEPRATEGPVVKEEPHCEGETDHCFVYDMAKTRGGWYSDGSCLELPFS